MLVYPIVHQKYSDSLFAPGTPGRWNGAGRKVIYAAESIPLAFMENMIRRKGLGYNAEFRIMIIEIDDKLKIKSVDPAALPAGWRSFLDYAPCEAVGNTLYDQLLSPVLKVPSAILPVSFNFVLNSEHPDFKLVRLLSTTTLVPDDRIEELLKGYKKL